MGQMLVEREAALREVLEWEAGLQALHAHIALRFSRSESRQRVLAYLQGLLGSVERKNGWQLAEYAGDATPDGVQRLLAGVPLGRGPGSGRPARVRDGAFGGDPGGVLVVDETGFLKQGQKSVGVKRQYSGTAGKVDRTVRSEVFLAYVAAVAAQASFWTDGSSTYPRNGLADGVRRQEAGVRTGRGGLPHQQARTGPRDDRADAVRRLATRALCLGNWGYASTAMSPTTCGGGWRNRAGVMCWTVKNNEPLWADTDPPYQRGSAPVAARRLADHGDTR